MAKFVSRDSLRPFGFIVFVFFLFSFLFNFSEVSLAQNQLPKVAIIIDDLGPGVKTYDLLFKNPYPLTLSVIPAQMMSTSLSARAVSINHYDIFIHLPMEPLGRSAKKNYPLQISKGMSVTSINEVIDLSRANIKNVKGINHHMGSYGSADPLLMEPIIEYCQTHQLIYVDSITTRNTVIKKIVEEKHYPYLRNNVFLDGKLKKKYIEFQFKQLIDHALKNGYAIGIAHANRELSMKMLPQLMKQYEDQVQFVRVSELPQSLMWQMPAPQNKNVFKKKYLKSFLKPQMIPTH